MNTKVQVPAAGSARDGKSRRWLRAFLIVLGAVALLAALLPVGLFAFYTSATPLTLPITHVTQAEREDLTRRWLEFQDAIRSDEQAVVFQFSSRDLNVFVDMMPRLRSRVYGVFESNRLEVQFCQPLSIGPMIRYVKGTASVIPAFRHEQLAIRVVACRVNGHALPGWICRQLGRKSLNPEAFGILERFDVQPYLRNLEVRDSCLILTPRHSEPAHEPSESPVH